MKKNILLILLMFSCFIVIKVKAVELTGTVANPDLAVVGEYYEISSNDMNALDNEDPNDGIKMMYYTYKFTVTDENEIHYWITAPAKKASDNSKQQTIIFAYITNADNDLDKISPIEAVFEELGEEEDYSIDTYLKPGNYYLMVGFVMDEQCYIEYTAGVEYYSSQGYKNELEPNNGEDEANQLELNVMYNAVIGDMDFNDYYIIKLNAGKKTRIYISEFEALSNANAMISIRNSNGGEKVDSIRPFIKYNPARIQHYYEFTPKKTDNYYINVDSNMGDRVNYSIGIYQAGTTNLHPLELVSLIKNNSSLHYPPVFRMYNPINGEHLYTTDTYEVEVIYKTQGWGFEGIGWYTTSTGTPVYRLYNPRQGNHLYTSDTYEISIITKKQGWVMDFSGKPVMYSTDDKDDMPVYRLYNQPLKGLHHLTTDENEYNVLPRQGWAQEGISMYVAGGGYPMATDYYNVNF